MEASTAEELSMEITAHLWLRWAEIAIDQALTARRVRSEPVQPGGGKIPGSVVREFQASMCAVAAASFSLDALFGSTGVPPSIRKWWPGKRPNRPTAIREALKRAFDTGPVNTTWVAEFSWLFDLRDAAVHAEAVPKPSRLHPRGMRTAQEHVDYSAESAARAVELALGVLLWCIDHPKRGVPEAVRWAEAHRAGVAGLEKRWFQVA
ncbi:hypothetical protein [Streptomyces sp. WM6378]|uniref:hypothetical protein n=1 Tax=Streptomyces sp. WM6378 TaxID=1415557 RepID=UPI00131B2E49|nr:hypothetical protein [Streptomyces sp. WM6378]